MEINQIDPEVETKMVADFKKVQLEEIQHKADMCVVLALDPVALGGDHALVGLTGEEDDEFTFGGDRKKAYKDEAIFEASSSAIRTRIRLTLQTGPRCRTHTRLTMIMERGDEGRVCIRRWGVKNPEELNVQQKLEMMANHMLETLTKMVDGV